MKRGMMNKTTILTDDEVKQLAREAASIIFGKEKIEDINYNERFEDYIRLMPLGAKCREVRGRLGLSLKEASAKFKIPQYRLKAIEEGQRGEILPGYLKKYIQVLGIKDWLKKWISVNHELAVKLDIDVETYLQD